MARNPHASYEASDHQRMPIIPKFTDYIANNLTTTVAGFALDARQGKILNETKLNIANVVNNLTTTVAGFALDARQGKVLDDKITSLNNSLAVGIVRITIAANARTSVPLTFPVAFPTAPKIVAAVRQNQDNLGRFICSVSNITATGCMIHAENKTTSQSDVSIDWIAVCK